MERVQKEQSSRDSANATRVFQGRFTRIPAQTDIVSRIDNSPQMIAQRKQLQGMFGGTAQLQEVEEEQPLQGKFTAVQRVEEEEPLQGKFETAQRIEDEEEPVQGMFAAVQRVEEEEPLQGKFAATAQLEQQPAAKPNNTGLPDNLKTGIESLSGISMDSVRVHYNSSQPAQLNALAYAQGSDIHVAPGQEQHLPHEAWHVVQQAQGRVQPTMQMKDGVPVNDDAGLEHEADVMGGKALQVQRSSFADNLKEGPACSSIQLSSKVIQRGINDLSETNKYDSEIYGITDEKSKNKDNVIYVGQTTQDWFSRFHQHTTDSKESDQPWHIDNYTYDQDDGTKWRFNHMEVYKCKGFTPLEITASEEYYYEEYDGLDGKLKNRQQPLTKSTFIKYKTTYPGTFRGKAVQFPSDSWEPKK